MFVFCLFSNFVFFSDFIYIYINIHSNTIYSTEQKKTIPCKVKTIPDNQKNLIELTSNENQN